MKKQSIKCTVNECKHLNNDECSLDQIKVNYSNSLDNATSKDETCCDNYKKKEQ